MKAQTFLRVAALIAALSAGATNAQSPPSVGDALLPANPTSADNLKLSLLPRTCGGLSPYKGNPYRVSMTQNSITVTLGERTVNPTPTCPSAAREEIDFGRLPAGNYTYSVVETTRSSAAEFDISNVPFVVADARLAKAPPYVRLDYSGHWWDPDDSGWGLFIWHDAADNILAAWFTYTPNGNPMWYVFQPGWQTASSTNSADLVRVERLPGATSPPPTPGTLASAGTASLDFTHYVQTSLPPPYYTTADEATLTYQFNDGPRLTRNLKRFNAGPMQQQVLPAASVDALLLPANPTSADNIKISMANTTCGGASGYAANSYTVAMSQNNITVTLGKRINGIHTLCPAQTREEMDLGRLPAGSYTLSLIESPDGIPISPSLAFSRWPFTVTDARAVKNAPFPRLDYSGHWWDPGDPGWGLFIWQDTHSFVETLLAAWFTYGVDGKPIWYVFQPSWQTATATFSAEMGHGNRLPGATSPPPVQTGATLAGTAGLDFTNVTTDDVGKIGYTFTGGTQQTRTIRRFNPKEISSPGSAIVWHISPEGNDAANGQTPATAWKTFAKAFATMAGGDELVLLDGQYSPATTGVINWETSLFGARSAQAPGGVSLSRMTVVRALNPGKVTINGPLFIGRSFRKDSYIRIQGITFEGGGELYNTSFNTIKDCGFHGTFGIGTNDHQNGNTDNLIEDVWIWAAEQRVIAINYRGARNVWRRVVVRGDGCSTADCVMSGSPNVGITVYDSRDVSLQNVVVIDRILSQAAINAGNHYADFATAQHTANTSYFLGRVEWLGSMSIKAPDSGFIFEADNTIPTDLTWKLVDIVAVGNAGDGVNIGGTGLVQLSNVTVVNASQTGDGVRVAPGSPGNSVTGIVVKGFNRGLNSSLQPSYTDVFGSASLYNQTAPTVGARTTNPTADGATPSLKYPTRIESGSALKGAGLAGADIGANVVYKIGVEGSRFGEANYNATTTNSLWPWPNQDRIKREMCGVTSRGFCASGTRLDGLKPISLTSYIWEQLGNPVPGSVDP